LEFLRICLLNSEVYRNAYRVITSIGISILYFSAILSNDSNKKEPDNIRLFWLLK